MFHTRLTKLFNVRVPILSAPMANVSGGKLAFEVSKAGGIGMIGAGYVNNPTWLRQQLDIMKQLRRTEPNVQYGIGVNTWCLTQQNECLQMIQQLEAEQAPHYLCFAFGDASPYVEQVRKRGITIISQCSSLVEVVAASTYSNIIVTQGREAGGHGSSEWSALALLQAARQALPGKTIVAAGGISDPATMATFLMAGADGVLMGTRFEATHESLLSDTAKQTVLKATAGSTVRNLVFDYLRSPIWPSPYDGRAINDEWAQKWNARLHQLAEPQVMERERAAFKAANAAVVWAGEGVGQVNEIEEAGTIIRRFNEQAYQYVQQRAAELIQSTNPPS